MDAPIIMFEVNEEEDGTGMTVTSFVTNPATQIAWQKFGHTQQLFSKDKMKRIVTGPIMLANTPIERYDKSIGKFYSKFSPKSLENMRNKFFKNNFQNRINENHIKHQIVDGVYLVESYIIDEKIKSNLFDVEPGSWIGSFWVEDEKYWNETIMSDEFTGFSLEGKFDPIPEEEYLKSAFNLVKSIFNSNLTEEEKYLQISAIIK
jgi:hypothetical protein